MLKRGVTKQVVVKRALKRVTSQELSSDLIEILHLKTGLEDEKILKRHAAFLGLKICSSLCNFLVDQSKTEKKLGKAQLPPTEPRI